VPAVGYEHWAKVSLGFRDSIGLIGCLGSLVVWVLWVNRESRILFIRNHRARVESQLSMVMRIILIYPLGFALAAPDPLGHLIHWVT
jgi:hypothetical protein